MASKKRLSNLMDSFSEPPMEEQAEPQQPEKDSSDNLSEGVKDLIKDMSPDTLKEVMAKVYNENPQNTGGKIPEELAKLMGISPEMTERLNEYRKANTGRPKGRRNGNPKPRGDRATFIVDKSVTRKLKYISLMETKLYKDVVAEALQEYINKWESVNGEINIPKAEDIL